jgi:hypothetical protein
LSSTLSELRLRVFRMSNDAHFRTADQFPSCRPIGRGSGTESNASHIDKKIRNFTKKLRRVGVNSWVHTVRGGGVPAFSVRPSIDHCAPREDYFAQGGKGGRIPRRPQSAHPCSLTDGLRRNRTSNSVPVHLRYAARGFVLIKLHFPHFGL